MKTLVIEIMVVILFWSKWFWFLFFFCQIYILMSYFHLSRISSSLILGFASLRFESIWLSFAPRRKFLLRSNLGLFFVFLFCQMIFFLTCSQYSIAHWKNGCSDWFPLILRIVEAVFHSLCGLHEYNLCFCFDSSSFPFDF